MLAVVLLTGLFMVHYREDPDAACRPWSGIVAPDGAAAKAGIKEGDQVVQIDDMTNPTWEDIAMKEIAERQAARARVGDAERRAAAFHRHAGATTKSRASGQAGWMQESEVEVARLRER